MIANCCYCFWINTKQCKPNNTDLNNTNLTIINCICLYINNTNLTIINCICSIYIKLI